jgi:hypothetical protein
MKAKKSNLDRSRLYTSSEVREKLDISGSTLKNLVEKEIIERVVPPGYSQGLYTKESVDNYYNEHELFTETYKAKKKGKLIVREALRSDEAAIYEMEKEVLGATVPLDKRLEWHIKNPNIDFIALSDNIVVGHLSLLPLKKQALIDLLTGKKRGWEISAEDIETYQKGNAYDLFVMAMATRGTEYPASNYAALLLREAQQRLYELADKGILIRAIYATSRTRDGVYLANRFGMEPVKEYNNRYRISFVLDMQRGQAKWARDYRAHLNSLSLPKELTKELQIAPIH